MKTKNYFLLFLLLFTTLSTAQTIFKETFDGISGSTAGGAGTYKFPSGWLLRNVDNRTPNGSVSYVNEAWERREDFQNNVIDSAAFSTSWYSPTGSSDDWMWTPEIILPAQSGTLKLSWRGKAYDPEYKDGYEVRIMTSPNTPTGGNGVLGNQVSASTLLLSVPAENSDWTPRNLDISNYAGNTVRIAFRNNSVDKFLLVIDDVKVEKNIEYDAEVVSVKTAEYSSIPLKQIPATGLPIGATVRNNGSSELVNVKIKASIYDETNTLITTLDSEEITSLVSGNSATPIFENWVPTSSGIYTVKYTPVLTLTDLVPANDSKSTIFNVSKTVYARDQGSISGTLGIGAGDGGYLGQSFTVNTEQDVESATVTYSSGTVGDKYQLALWDTDDAGKPLNKIAETAEVNYENTSAFTATLPFVGGTKKLLPGKYVITAVEFSTVISLASTDEIFTPGTVWVNWPSSPLGGWANVEAFGSSFAKTFALRLNFKENVDPPLGTDAVSNKRITIYPNPFTDRIYLSDANNIKIIEITDISGKKVLDVKVSAEINLSHLVKGVYLINIMTKDGKIQTHKVIKK